MYIIFMCTTHVYIFFEDILLVTLLSISCTSLSTTTTTTTTTTFNKHSIKFGLKSQRRAGVRLKPAAC